MSKYVITERSVPNYAENLILGVGVAKTVTTIVADGDSRTNATTLAGSPEFVVTGADGTKGVILQGAIGNQPSTGLEYSVYNSAAAVLNVYPPSGGNFNGGTTNIPLTIPANGRATFKQMTSTVWTGGASAAASPTVISLSATQSVAAAGANQGNAAAITAATPGNVLVTGADATKGVVLPAAIAGAVYNLKNADAANAILKVYPAGTDTINALTGGASISMAAKTSATFYCVAAGAWFTNPLLPS